MRYSRRWSAVLAMLAAWMCAVVTAHSAVTDLGTRVTVAAGNDPDVAIDSAGNLHIVFESGGNTYYKKIAYPSGTELIGARLVGGGTDPQVAIDSADNPHVIMGAVTYSRWTGGGFSTPVQALAGANRSRMCIDSQDRVYIITTDRNSSTDRVKLRVFQHGAAIAGPIVVGDDSAGSIECDSKDVIHISYRYEYVLWYSQYRYGGNVSPKGEAIKGSASDFSWVAVDPRDDTLHIVSTHQGGTAVDFVHGTSKNWGSTSYAQSTVLNWADVTQPTCGVDFEGYTYATYTGAGNRPYLFVMNPNNTLLAQNILVDGTSTGLKYKNPNIGTRPDMSGAYITWGEGTVYVRSIGDVSLISSAPKANRCYTPAQDYDGDGQDDAAVFSPDSSVWTICMSRSWLQESFTFGNRGDYPVPGRYNAANRADLALYCKTNAVWTIRNGATGATNHIQWGKADEIPVPADYDGDGVTDLAVYNTNDFNWYIRGSTAGSNQQVLGWATALTVPGDYDGDGRADIAVVDSNTGRWYVKYSKGGDLTNVFLGSPGDVYVPADYDTDGKIDIAAYTPANGAWRIRQSSTLTTQTMFWGWSDGMPVPGKYDRDNITDIAVHHAAQATWHIRQSTDGTQMGLPPIKCGEVGDTLVNADYDGDKKADAAVYRPTTGTWIIQFSSGGSTNFNWGWSAAHPVPADYDGDGKADAAVYWPTAGRWYIRYSGGGSTTVDWGWSAANPVPSDYDGDKKVDMAVYWPAGGRWYIRYSNGGSATVDWGWSAATPVPDDYDGDGFTDIAVYGPANANWNTWYIRYSNGGSAIVDWGWNAAVPVRADYDGDKKADIAVYWPAAARWYIKYSNGGSTVLDWGWNMAIPVPADYDGDGKSDVSVSYAGDWWISGSLYGKVLQNTGPFTLGSSTDIPLGKRQN